MGEQLLSLKNVHSNDRSPSKLKARLQLLGACRLHRPPHPSPSLKFFSRVIWLAILFRSCWNSDFPFIAYTWIKKDGDVIQEEDTCINESDGAGIVQLHIFCQLLGSEKGTTVPHIWQPPQITQLTAGIWPNWWKGIHGGVKGGGEAGEEGRQGPCGRGWVDGGLAPVGKFFSVEFVELLDRISFLGPLSSSFSSTLTLFPCSFWEADSSCNLFSSLLLENLVSVSLRESSRDNRGNPFFSLSISWKTSRKARSLLIQLPLPLRLRFRGVWVQASLAVASQLESSFSSTLQTAKISPSLSGTPPSPPQAVPTSPRSRCMLNLIQQDWANLRKSQTLDPSSKTTSAAGSPLGFET